MSSYMSFYRYFVKLLFNEAYRIIYIITSVPSYHFQFSSSSSSNCSALIDD